MIEYNVTLDLHSVRRDLTLLFIFDASLLLCAVWNCSLVFACGWSMGVISGAEMAMTDSISPHTEQY